MYIYVLMLVIDINNKLVVIYNKGKKIYIVLYIFKKQVNFKMKILMICLVYMKNI